MKKPEKTEVTLLIKGLKQSSDKIKDIATDYSLKVGAIKRIVAKRKKNGIKQALDTIPVEDLNLANDGINIQALKAAGKNYLCDLVGLTQGDLKSINGIGETMAEKIFTTVYDAEKKVENDVKFKITEEDLKDDEIKELLTSVFFLLNCDNSYEQAISLGEQAKDFRDDIPEAEKLNTKIWLFTNAKDKETRLAAYEKLCKVKDTGFIDKVNDCELKYKKALKATRTPYALDSYKSNTAPFFAMIEKVTGSKMSQATTESTGLTSELLDIISDFKLDTSLMNSTLRSYQDFGTKYILNQKRVLLGDEMGLGKTIQAIASIAHLYNAGKKFFTVVCPVSVMVNWAREIEKHSKLKTMRIHGDNREKQFEDFIENGGVAITTFETLSKLPLEKLQHIDMLTVDEAHYVKNPNAQRTKALKVLTDVSEYVLLMTGTPLENKVEEMIFLISMLKDNLSKELSSMITLNKAPVFRNKIAPVYLRRVREDVLSELPEKLESEEWVDFTSPEKDLYRKALTQRSAMACRKISYEVENIADSSKLTRLLELCDEAKADGRKIVIFSFFLGVLDKVQAALGDRCFGRITGAIPSEERQDIIDKFAEAPDGSVILSQIIAGGVGLNIQCASVVIICEPQWKPSTENQAISRCYRMGQSKSVLVYRLLNADSVDEDITKLLKEKSQVFDEYADESEVGEISKSMDAIIEKQRVLYGIVDEAPVSEEISKTDENLHTDNSNNEV